VRDIHILEVRIAYPTWIPCFIGNPLLLKTRWPSSFYLRPFWRRAGSHHKKVLLFYAKQWTVYSCSRKFGVELWLFFK